VRGSVIKGVGISKVDYLLT